MGLQIENLSKTINGQQILKDVNLDMQAGSIVGLVGRNGAGKTTLMRLIAGEMQADTGCVRLDKADLADVFYLDTLSNWMNSYNAITAASVLEIFYEQFDKQAFFEILKDQNLSAKKTIASFSKGQKALVYVAAGVASGATYLLFDEPLDGLDVFVKDYFKKILLEVVDNGRCVMIATHNLTELDSLADCIFLIKDSEIVEQEKDTDIVKIQFVYEGDTLPSNLLEVATILEQRGRVYLALVTNDVVACIFSDHLTYKFVEILQVTTEDVFRKELG
jgi:ABC-2 type transport system ATP-binding protein